jgi:hypothetical protein
MNEAKLTTITTVGFLPCLDVSQLERISSMAEGTMPSASIATAIDLIPMGTAEGGYVRP